MKPRMVGATVACAVTYFGVVVAGSILVALVMMLLSLGEQAWQGYHPDGDQALDAPWLVLRFLGRGWWVLPAGVLVSVGMIHGLWWWVCSEAGGIAVGLVAALVPLAVAGTGIAYVLYHAAAD